MEHLARVHLNGLRAAEAAGRLGSFRAAAEELGVSVGAVSQHVIRLEARLERQIFERRPRGLEPTGFGAAFLAGLTEGFARLDRAVALAERRDDAMLTITVAPVFAARWLVPRLAAFSRRHPRFQVRLDASTALADLETSDFDLAIRVGKGGWQGVAARLLLAQEVFPVCAPGLARGIAAPRDLLALPVVRDANSVLRWQTWLDAFGLDEAALSPGHSYSDASLCLDAAIAGQGVMLAWQTLAQDALADGRLVAPFAHRAKTGFGYWLLTAAARRPPAKVKVFGDWIAGEIARTEGSG